jgi:hypothetical protein
MNIVATLSSLIVAIAVPLLLGLAWRWEWAALLWILLFACLGAIAVLGSALLWRRKPIRRVLMGLATGLIAGAMVAFFGLPILEVELGLYRGEDESLGAREY